MLSLALARTRCQPPHPPHPPQPPPPTHTDPPRRRPQFNGQPNFAFSGGDFAVDVAGIAPYAAPRPSLVLVSSAGAERSARIGDDAAARGADVPIVQLNPGGVLTHKYHGEAAVRSHAARGLTYTVLRPTGLDAPDAAAAAAPAGPPPPPPALEFAQGDWASGTLSRADVAAAVASALRTPRACGVTAELRRVAPGSSDRAPAGPAALDAAWGRLAPDAGRTAAGLRPLPAPGPVPPPPTPEQVAALMARPDVAAAAARNKAAREAAAAAEQAAAGAQGAAAETAAAAR